MTSESEGLIVPDLGIDPLSNSNGATSPTSIRFDRLRHHYTVKMRTCICRFCITGVLFL